MADDLLTQTTGAPRVQDSAGPPETNFFDQFDGAPALRPTAPAAPAAKPSNPFDRFDTEADAGDPGIGERWRLNQTESYYRGTLRGSAHLSTLADIYSMRKSGTSDEDILSKVKSPVSGPGSDEFFATPADAAAARRKWIADQSDQYEKVIADLARYDMMRPFGNTGEAATALVGQLSGGLQSPESYLGAPARGASWLIRTGKAGLQQAGIMGVTDPIVQANNIASQTQAEYEPSRTAMAIGLGAVIGGGLHLATGELIPALKVRQTIRDMATEDPSFRRADIPPEPAATERPPSAGAGEPKAPEGTEAAPTAEPAPAAAAGSPEGTPKAAELNTTQVYEIMKGMRDGREVPEFSAQMERMTPEQRSMLGEIVQGKSDDDLRVLSTDVVDNLGKEPAPRGAPAQVEASNVAALMKSSGDEAALAARQGGGKLKMERARAGTGVPSQPGTTGTAITTVPNAPSPAQETAIRSLQQQAFDFADAIGFPLREGRVGVKGALGTFNTRTGVVRVKEAPDFEVVAHEAGHAIERKVGKELTGLTNKFGTELAPLVSAPGAYKPAQHVMEGFAEWIRRYIGNPAHAEQVAPGFAIAFRDFMGKKSPEILKAIDDASTAYRAYLEAPSVDVIGAVRRSRAEDVEGWRGVIASIREDGFPAVVRTVLQRAYTAVFDDKAPVARAVRDMAREISIRTGKPVDLKAADNPETLMRLFGRSHQAAMLDMTDGVRPYHDVTPQGPSLHDALAKATGQATVFGKWNPELKSSFSDFLIARRATVLWDKFAKGDLPNPPTAFSKGDAVTAMAELERANPQFREASDMVHNWTRELLRKQYEGGLIGRDLYDRLAAEPFYVPFMRDLSDKPLAGGDVARAGGRDRVADTVQRIKGSSRDIKDPIESLMMQAFLVNRTLQHNDVIRSLVRLGKAAGPEGGRFIEPLPAHEAKRYTFDLADSIERLARERGVPPDDIKLITGALTDVFGKDPLVGSFFRMEPAGKRGEPIVFYKEGGELRVARMMAEQEGHALYETLTALPAHFTDGFSELVAATSSIVRSGIITNPMFAVTNYIRDQFAVGILRRDYVPMASGLPGIASEFKQGESAKLYAYGGGVAPGSAIAPVERAIEADIDALAKKGYLVNRLTSFKGALELASFTEAGTRNSVFSKVYKAKKAEGLSDYEAMIEAAFQSTDLLDFSRHGSRTLAIRNYLPFLNAHFQGVDKAKRTILDPIVQKLSGDQVFAGDKEAFTNAMLATVKVFGVGGMLGAGWAALNADSEAYRDTSPAIKGTHVVIPWGRNILLWPKPFELGVGFTAGEYAYQKLAQNDPRAAAQFVTAAWQALEPPNPLQDIPLLKTYFELKSGKNLFTGNDIVPDRLARLAAAQQYTDKTSSLAKFVGSTINVSPMKVDYAVGSMFGSWGRDIMTLSSGVDPDAPAQSWEDTVFLRRLIKDPGRTSDVTTKYWGYMGQTTGTYNQDVNTYDFLNKTFKDAQAQDFLAKLPAAERAFVIMKSGADEDGKAAFNSAQKNLHPLQRSYAAVTLLNGVRRELTDNAFATYEAGQNIRLDPTARRDLNENVRELAQMEMRNAFVIMKEPGYAGRPLFDVKAPMDKIRAISPQVADEIATRYATSKIYPTDAVAKAYPALQSSLIRDGSSADLTGLADDAASNGYEFGAERAKKPQKRRVPIGADIKTAPPQ